MNHNVNELVNLLDLQPHPEGGFFKETYRSTGEINQESLDASYNGKRNYSTCIYFLLTSDNFSAFHRIKQDEIWHFYDGSTIKLHVIANNGDYTNYNIGIDIANGEVPQAVVEGGSWFAAEVLTKDSYSLVGCTVAPGFDFQDFELKSGKELVSLFPQHENLILRLTHH